MAKEFEKGQHLFFIFENGVAKRNSQNRACCFTDRKKAELNSNGIGEIVEYEPVTTARWKRTRGYYTAWACSNCGGVTDFNPANKERCPRCCAHMIDWEDSDGIRHSVQG